MQQNNYVNPADVLSGRKFLSKAGRKLAMRRALPYFWAARDTLGIVFLIPLFLWMRLPNLMALPIFYDETIYLSYAREYMTDPQRNALISAERDGKPPLFIWGLSWFWNLFPDPLTGARLMSVVGGAVSCILIYLIGKRLYSPVAGFLSSLFYILCPLFVLHNRLAVHSSWETVAGMGTLYFAIAIAQQPRAAFALGMGASLGLGMLVKQSALFYFGLAPLVAFYISRRPDIWARLKEHQPGILRRFSVWWYKMRIPRLPKFGFGAAATTRRMLNERESTTLWVVTKAHKKQVYTQRALKIRAFTFMAIVGFVGIAVAGAIYLPLQTHPEASYLSSTDTSYALTLPELLRFPMDIWRSNFDQTWEWWLTYYSIPLMVLAVAALGYAVVKPKYAQAEVILLAWTILPIFAQMLLARQHWFSRYITPFGPPMLIVGALVIVRLSKYVIRISRERMNWTGAAGAMFGVCLTLIVIIPWLHLDDQLINRPVEAELASRDRWQYIEGWPSGYAMEDSIAYIRTLAATDPVLIYMDQDNVTQETYYLDRLNTLKGWVFYGRTNGVNWLTRNFRGERNTYYLTSVQPDEILMPYLKLSKTFPKPGGKSSISIYHFVAPEVGPEPVIKAEGL